MNTTFRTVADLCAAHSSWLTEGGLRWLVFNADKNGLAKSGALVRLGRRVLFDEEKFLSWVRTSPAISPAKEAA